MKVTVLVRPRDGILDPQGQAIDRSLQGLGYASDDGGATMQVQLGAVLPGVAGRAREPEGEASVQRRAISRVTQLRQHRQARGGQGTAGTSVNLRAVPFRDPLTVPR